MKKVLLIDYPHPDGWAREKYLKALGCEVLFFDLVRSRVWPGESKIKNNIKSLASFLKPVGKITSYLDTVKLNRELICTVREFRPEIVFMIKGDNIFTGTLEKIKRISSPVMINWYPDSILSPDRKQFVYSRLPIFDLFFLIDEIDLLPPEIRKSIAARNTNVSTLPFAANTDFYRKIELTDDEKKEFEAEIAFIGVINPVRKKVLEKLKDFDLKIWGPNESAWGKWLETGSPLSKSYQNKCAFGSDAVKIYSNSSIVMDIHFLFSVISEIPNVTTRVYEVPASGGFVLTNYSPQLSRLFKIGEEIVCYRNENELREMVTYYLNNHEERKIIIAKGRERVLREHTYLNRLKHIFSLIR